MDDVSHSGPAGGSIAVVAIWGAHRDLGLVTRDDARADGLSDRAIRCRLSSGRWQRLHSGIYITRPGSLSWLTRASAAVLACGPDASLADRSAAHVHELLEDPGPLIWVVVPESRRVVAPMGVHVRRARKFSTPGPQWPPRTSVPATLVDLADDARADDIAAWLARSLQRRITMADRLLNERAGRARHPQRALLRGMIQDIRGGVESTLEMRFVTGVLRPHGLPRGEAQMPLASLDPQLDRTRADRGYRLLKVLIELDGVRYHQGPSLVLDRRKSTVAATLGWMTVRYGWTETVDRPCATAIELARLFWARGWTGAPQACSPGCPVRRLVRERPA